jgi:hypothetical protein
MHISVLIVSIFSIGFGTTFFILHFISAKNGSLNQNYAISEMYGLTHRMNYPYQHVTLVPP